MGQLLAFSSMKQLLLICAVVALVGCAGPPSFGSKKTWQSDVFSAHVLGKTTAEILEEFGKPDSVKGDLQPIHPLHRPTALKDDNIFYWTYWTNYRVIDTDSGKESDTVAIYFDQSTRKVVNTLFRQLCPPLERPKN